MTKPEYVRVKSKETKHEFTIAKESVNDTVTVIDKPAVDGNGPLLPKPNVSLRSGELQAQDVNPGAAKVGDSGNSKEGSK